MAENFKYIDGEPYISRSYKVKRLKELTTELNRINAEIKKLKNKRHTTKHNLEVTKGLKTFEG